MTHPVLDSLLTAREHMRQLYEKHDSLSVIKSGGGHGAIIRTTALMIADMLEWFEHHDLSHEPPDMMELVLQAVWEITTHRLSEQDRARFIDSDDEEEEEKWKLR